MCDYINCSVKNPVYNFPGEKKGKRCKKHSEEGMIDVKNKKCNFVYEDGSKCNTQPRYGFYGKKPEKCSKHALPEMEDLVSKKCNFIDPATKNKCKTRASFGFVNGKVEKCSKHALPKMEDLKHKKCEYQKCKTRPSFGFLGETTKRCEKHKLEGMIDLVNKKCDYIGEEGSCNIIPIFGFLNDKPKRCKKHAEKGMIDLIHKKCLDKDCYKRPTFNFPDKKTAIYCKEHKKDNMIDVLNNKCEFDGCEIQPSFNYKQFSNPINCKEHALEGMIDVVSKFCEVFKCFKRPIFNYKGEIKGIRCKEHKLKDMVDVCHKLCDECNNRASFGYLNGTPKKCFLHKKENMIDITRKKCEKCQLNAEYGELFTKKTHCYKHKLANEFYKNKPICEFDDCLKNAFYTNDGSNYPIRCEYHKFDEDINIIEKECKKCNLVFFLNEKTGLCNYCNDYEINKIHKIKETKTLNFLKENRIEFISEDKIPENGCSKYRPDAVIDFVYFIVIIEIDEYQHKNYNNKCEMTRMIQLHQDYGGIPVIFIRFNPDNYYIREDDKKKIIKANNKRFGVLLETIKRLENLKKIEDKKLPSLSVCYLFYDNYMEPEFKEIDILSEISK